MNQDPVRVSSIQLESAFPSLTLIHAARHAFSLQVMIPTIAVVIVLNGLIAIPNAALRGRSSQQDSPGRQNAFVPFERLGIDNIELANRFPKPLAHTVVSAQYVFGRGIFHDVRETLRLLFRIGVLMLIGAAVSRISAAEYCRDERTGVIRAVRAAIRSWKPLVTSTGLAFGLLWLPWFAFGLLSWCLAFSSGLFGMPYLAGVIQWLAGFGLCIWTLVVSLAWILSLSAVATDGCDGADALSRGINYCLSHRLRTGCYAAIIVLLIVVFGETMRTVCDYATIVTIDTIVLQPSGGMTPSFKTPETAAASACARVVVTAFQLGILFCGTTIAYILLREREDGVVRTEMLAKP
jgi:hypothetical protein